MTMKESVETTSWTIDPEHDALVVVDLQPDFMPGGPLAVRGGDEIIEPIAALIPRFECVVATQDWHPQNHISFASRHRRPAFTTIPLYGGDQTLWPDHCVQGSKGAALHRGLPMDDVTLLLRKGIYPHTDSYSAFRENLGPDGKRHTTGLGAMLSARGITRVFFCGLARDFCVGWSALDAQQEGFVSFVLNDLTRAVFPEQQDQTDAQFAAASVKHGNSSQLGGGK